MEYKMKPIYDEEYYKQILITMGNYSGDLNRREMVESRGEA